MAKKKTTKTSRTRAGGTKAKGKKPAPKKTKAGKAPAKAGKAVVRVRMYRQGLGDCFLLSFPKADGQDFHILIDCGVILGTPDADSLIKAVVDDIAATTKRLDVLVATHEHWDHVSGFHPAKKWFEPFTIGQVWLAWTEDPHDATANSLRRERAHKLAALWLGVGQMRLRLGAAGQDGEARDTLERAVAVLSFFGIDPDEPPPEGGFGAAAAAAGGKTAAAMEWVRKKTPNPQFWKPGQVIDLKEAGGVRVYVLGPPTDRAQLFKDLPTKSGQETYDDDNKPHLAAAERSFFGAAFSPGADPGLRPEFDPSRPFDFKYMIDREEAQGMEFFRDHYLGSEAGDPEAWRRIEGEWMAGAAEFALNLDSDTNNTSLALAFELPDGRVLLFPGDAQVGNWESWHADSDGKKQTWKVNGKDITAEELLNRTVLYKVGHHGSHNATLRDKGLEMMTDPNLVAMIPVDVYIAHVKKRWTKMPFLPLVHRLKDKTQGRILQVDQASGTLPAEEGGNGASGQKDLKSFLTRVTDSEKQLKVTGPDGKPVTRPLYVEYAVPALEKS